MLPTLALFLAQLASPTMEVPVEPLPVPTPTGQPATVPAPQPPVSQEQAELDACLEVVREDPTSAIAGASRWAGEVDGAALAYPLQCLGVAYTRLNRWQAAADAFTEARDVTTGSPLRRALYGGMAGTARLQAGDGAAALPILTTAEADARSGGDIAFAGSLAVDVARAHAALGDDGAAATALERARRDAPQALESWLASAAFARASGDLASAQGYIETAGAIDPRSADVGLEAGVIAALAGRDDAARRSFESVRTVAPGSPQAELAADYLAQLNEGATP